MFTNNDLDITPEELESASGEVRQKWGAEIDEKLEDLLEHQITAEVDGLESLQPYPVIIHYKPHKSFDDFHEEFSGLLESYHQRNEEFEFSEIEEFERLVDEGTVGYKYGCTSYFWDCGFNVGAPFAIKNVAN